MMTLPREDTTGRRLEQSFILELPDGSQSSGVVDIVFDTTQQRDLAAHVLRLHPWILQRVFEAAFRAGGQAQVRLDARTVPEKVNLWPMALIAGAVVLATAAATSVIWWIAGGLA